MTVPMPWSIALCITELNFGGAEHSLVELATRLDREQFRPEVYCFSARPIGPGGTLAARLEVAAIPVHFFGASRRWIPGECFDNFEVPLNGSGRRWCSRFFGTRMCLALWRLAS